MASRYENQCVSCDVCIGRHCPKRNAVVYICDECGDEIDSDVYEVDDEHLCEGCLKHRYRKVV